MDRKFTQFSIDVLQHPRWNIHYVVCKLAHFYVISNPSNLCQRFAWPQTWHMSRSVCWYSSMWWLILPCLLPYGIQCLLHYKQILYTYQSESKFISHWFSTVNHIYSHFVLPMKDRRSGQLKQGLGGGFTPLQCFMYLSLHITLQGLGSVICRGLGGNFNLKHFWQTRDQPMNGTSLRVNEP